jgi:hypothetical protein
MKNTIAVLILAAVAAAAQESPTPVSSGATAGAAPTEIVVRGEGGKLSDAKPPLKIDVDAFETIRPDLQPDQELLLAVSPLTVAWRRTHPDFLMNDRVIQPWRGTFSQRPGIPFLVRAQLEDALGQKLDDRAAKTWAWSLTIADEDGRPFHHIEGSGAPPVELLWSGQNAQNEWLAAGRPYSPVYRFTAPDGSTRTRVGAPLLLKGVVHQEDTGLHITLDSSALFGSARTGTELVQPAGPDLLRSAADLIKRRYPGLPIAVTVYANTKELGATQAAIVQTVLLRELMLAARYVTTDSDRAAFSDQRVEVVLLNR